jgi:wyosine [tRNA(Phe)-imidazoG37] synthetase (radical SAM superfamily)
MLLELKKEIIYGPVNSRRLGRSLGINILAGGKKVCTFNCVYCQYGWTKIHTIKPGQSLIFPSAEEVKKALEEALRKMASPPAYITFSGNGEPTLHPDFAQIVEEVTAVRDRTAPEAKTAILSNSSLVAEKNIREALSRLDTRIMKLDCGSEEVFKRYNKPCRGVGLEAIIEGLSRLNDVTIQTLVASGQEGNFELQNISSCVERLMKIRPSSVQLYTLDRGYPADDLKPATKEELDRIKSEAEKAGISIGVF